MSPKSVRPDFGIHGAESGAIGVALTGVAVGLAFQHGGLSECVARLPWSSNRFIDCSMLARFKSVHFNAPESLPLHQRNYPVVESEVGTLTGAAGMISWLQHFVGRILGKKTAYRRDDQ
jgi:hypothetical protein